MGLSTPQTAATTIVAHFFGHRRPIIYDALSAGRHLPKLFDALAEALKRFARLEYIDACGRCKLSINPQEVPAALQSPRRKTLRLAVERAEPHTPRGAP